MEPPCVAKSKSLYHVTGRCHRLSSGFWVRPTPTLPCPYCRRPSQAASFCADVVVRATCEGSKVQILVLVSFLRFHLQCPNSTPTDGWEWGSKRLKCGGPKSLWLMSMLDFPPAPFLKCSDIATAQRLHCWQMQAQPTIACFEGRNSTRDSHAICLQIRSVQAHDSYAPTQSMFANSHSSTGEGCH